MVSGLSQVHSNHGACITHRIRDKWCGNAPFIVFTPRRRGAAGYRTGLYQSTAETSDYYVLWTPRPPLPRRFCFAQGGMIHMSKICTIFTKLRFVLVAVFAIIPSLSAHGATCDAGQFLKDGSCVDCVYDGDENSMVYCPGDDKRYNCPTATAYADRVYGYWYNNTAKHIYLGVSCKHTRTGSYRKLWIKL